MISDYITRLGIVGNVRLDGHLSLRVVEGSHALEADASRGPALVSELNSEFCPKPI